MRYGSPIQTYTVLPPKRRIIYSEDRSRTPAEQYLGNVDALLEQTRRTVLPGSANDLVSLVFANQALDHEVRSLHVAQLCTERRSLALRHLQQLRDRIEELRTRLPWRGGYSTRNIRDRGEQETEQQILDLERQQRDIEITLWRDTLELRRELLDERRESRATRTRVEFLSGGTHGGGS